MSGMHCTACAVSVEKKILESGGGSIHVNFTTGEATFDKPDDIPLQQIMKGIESLGYRVVGSNSVKGFTLVGKDGWLLVISAILTMPLLLHMFVDNALLMHPLFQFSLSLPVFVLGIFRFGRSAWSSLRLLAPNMDVLIMTGAMASFVYSVLSWKFFPYNQHPVLYFETTASIITLVLLGNYLEHRTVKETTTALRELVAMKPSKAKRISLHLGEQLTTEIDIREVVVGDLLAVLTGDQIAADGVVVGGSGLCDESLVNGESVPVEKSEGSMVYGGTHLEHGNLTIRVEKSGNTMLLNQIIEQVKDAQRHKPSIQKLGDKVSHVFVPVVMLISLLTFFVSYFFFSVESGKALMSAIAVLVISCPCALGLATPTAVMAGIGRATRSGMLIRGGQTLEVLSEVKTVVFDKTGTLTDGRFSIHEIHVNEKFRIDEVKAIVGRLEQYSNHPIARSVAGWERLSCSYTFDHVTEMKGYGLKAVDQNNNTWILGSLKFMGDIPIEGFETFDLFLTCNEQMVAAMCISDQVRSGAAALVRQLELSGKRMVMISGDREHRCAEVAALLGIKEYYYGKLPDEKTAILAELRKYGKVAMVGDGINDAPALASADVGISLSGATDVAIKSAQVVLMQQGNIALLEKVFSISDLTMRTIRQNLFFSFFYNVLAIPIAAAGFLSPVIGTLAMALSDVVVVGNSIRLKFRSVSR